MHFHLVEVFARPQVLELRDILTTSEEVPLFFCLWCKGLSGSLFIYLLGKVLECSYGSQLGSSVLSTLLNWNQALIRLETATCYEWFAAKKLF